MIKWLYRFRNYHKVSELEQKIETYREANKRLEEEVREYKGYKLKYEVTKLYVDDDPALEELFALAERKREIERIPPQIAQQQIYQQSLLAQAQSDFYGRQQNPYLSGAPLSHMGFGGFSSPRWPLR